MSNADARDPRELPDNFPAEDLVLKSAMQFFGEELLLYLGITDKPVKPRPTEFVHLEVKQLYEDFNFMLTRNSWIHLEFESDSIKTEDLRRFRSYEAVTGYICHTDITTYVICSSTVKEVRSQLKTGCNTYRIIPIRLKNLNADKLFEKVVKKRENKEPLDRQDLVPLLLATLMAGAMDQKDRIINASQLLIESGILEKTDLERMQAVLYTLANKFLSKDDLNKVKEAMFMTPLGKMLFSDGFDSGIEKGIEKGAQALITTCQETGISQHATLEKLIDKLELTAQDAGKYMALYWQP